MNMLRSTSSSSKSRSSNETPGKLFGSYPDFDTNSVNKLCERTEKAKMIFVMLLIFVREKTVYLRMSS